MAEKNGKVVVITGASSGIGAATARLLSARGNKVVLGARREDKLKALADEIKQAGGQSVYLKTDVTARAEVEGLAKLAVSEYGRIDVWINNAGLMPLSEFSKLLVEDWERVVDVNIKGVLYGIAAALPVMRNQQGGQFINISSLSGHQAGPGSGVYAGSKFAVMAISEALRQEEAAANSNIRVSVISPGAVNTELPESITDPDVKVGIGQFYAALAISADRVAESIAFAMDMPEDTAINEIIIRPAHQQL